MNFPKCHQSATPKNTLKLCKILENICIACTAYLHHLPSFRFSHINRFALLSLSIFSTHLVMLRLFFYILYGYWYNKYTRNSHRNRTDDYKIGNHIIFTEICCFLHQHKSDIENALELRMNVNTKKNEEKIVNSFEIVNSIPFPKLLTNGTSFFLSFAFWISCSRDARFNISVSCWAIGVLMSCTENNTLICFSCLC